jgi:hypothetical protein
MKLATFCPASWTRTPLTAAAASAAVQLRPVANLHIMISCRVVNSGDNIAYIAMGPAGVTATVNSIEVLPKSCETLRVPFDATHVAAISPAGTTLGFTLGDGM